jgi:hypothetical protein
MTRAIWTKGRGKLGFLTPLLGQWRHEGGEGEERFDCVRHFEKVLGGKYVQLSADWSLGSGKGYQEKCLFGVDADGTVRFWSFTSDGKQSQGWLSAASDIAPDAICFEADMDMGRARQVYWPGPDGTMLWAVENRNKVGWKRFVDHVYRPI